MPRRVWAILLALGALCVAAPTAASAAVTSVLAGKTVSGQPIPCVAAAGGVRVCHGDDGGLSGPDLRLKSFDSAPLEGYVILPPAPPPSPDGRYPLVVQSHGWGRNATGLGTPHADLGPSAGRWAMRGHAVVQ